MGPYKTVAGPPVAAPGRRLARRARQSWYVAAAFLLVATAPPPAMAQGSVVEQTIVVEPGTYYHEELYVADPSLPWEGEFDSVSGQRIDVYIVRTTDLFGAYPDNNFEALVESENVTYTSFDFVAPNRYTSYSLIIDNLDNSNPFDANAGQPVTVHMARTAPLRSNEQAQGLLAGLTGVCAAILLLAAVGVAVYLRYRRPGPSQDESALPPRVEIDVKVPKRPRGAWAASEAVEPDAPPEGGGGPSEGSAGSPAGSAGSTEDGAGSTEVGAGSTEGGDGAPEDAGGASEPGGGAPEDGTGAPEGGQGGTP